MKKLLPLFYIYCFLIYLTACKIDSPVFPEKPDVPNPTDTTKIPATTIDKALLTGWWAPTVTTRAKVYFGTDNFFYLDTLSKDSPPTAGFWRTSGDTIKYSQNLNGPSPATYIVNKLTADSLVVTFDAVKTAYHKIGLPAITSTPISTIAGNGIMADYPDGVVASATAMWGTFGLSITKTGDIYFCDRGWGLIRKISAADGKVTTIAGYYGSSGGALYPPNSSATNASLALPAFLALDNQENVYVTESVGNRIGKITPGGKITCLAGCTPGIQSGFSGDGGPATAALLNDPKGIAVDSLGNVYFADGSNYRIRKISAADGKITTIAGNGNFNYSGDGGQAINAGLAALGLSLDAAGNIYFADVAANRIRKIAKATGIITTIAGTGVRGSTGDGGQATSATFNAPYSIHVNATGDIYILDGNNNSYVARKIDAKTGIIKKVAGTGFNGFTGDGIHATGYSLKSPISITTDAAGNIYVGEEGRIRKINK
jgi:hypothetical protein